VLLRRVLDKNQKNYKKDTGLAYKSFLDLLGNGIITSHGEPWRKQRTLLGNAFRVDILQETAVGQASRVAQGTGTPHSLTHMISFAHSPWPSEQQTG
jgi:cytochrome P450